MFVTIEQGALRVGEAVSLKWGDVDAAGLRLRLPRSATKRDQARWIYLSEWPMQAIDATCPLEDRTPDRRVFQGITEATFYQAMVRACQTAGIPTTRRTASDTGGSRSGISPASLPASSRNAPATPERR